MAIMLDQLRSWFNQTNKPRPRNGRQAIDLRPSANSFELRPKHPEEMAPIDPKDYGQLMLQTQTQTSIIAEDGTPLLIKDLFAHMIVFGESGSGKTFFVLNQLLDQLFHSTHLPVGPEREAKKFGGLIIEAKGDFTPKTWALAQKYGRMEDIIFFGPDHLDQSYNMFGDATESPQQLADKLLQLLTAFGGGKKSEDPFWDHAARKLFTHLFLLHRKLEKMAWADLPPMSFELLNLLIMDRGQTHNQAQLETDRQNWEKTYEQFLKELRAIRSLILPLTIELSGLQQKTGQLRIFLQNQLREWQVLQSQIPSDDQPQSSFYREEIRSREESLREVRAQLSQLENLTGDSSQDLDQFVFLAQLEQLQQSVHGIFNAQDDQQRGSHYQSFLDQAQTLFQNAWPYIHLWSSLDNLPPLQGFANTVSANQLIQLLDHLTQATSLGEQIMNWSTPEAETGLLRRLVNSYAQNLTHSGQNPSEDSLYAYFHEEYLNVVNDKTSGSVGMVASNLVTMFVHPPFNRLFSAQPSFTMLQVVDQGKLVVLDMPMALFGASATVAALVLKLDFFRTMLSRSRLLTRDTTNLGSGLRLLNQERPMIYFCDEFASVASQGETTGEAGFLDKVREYRCCCLLGLQSIPMLLKRFPESEIDALLTNCGMKIFLRNSDPRTNEIASKVLGQHYRVSLNRGHTAMEMAFNTEMPIGKQGFTTSYNLGPRVEPGEFARLQDGEAFVRLNPRFGKNQILRLRLVGSPILPPNPPQLFPLPQCTEWRSDHV